MLICLSISDSYKKSGLKYFLVHLSFKTKEVKADKLEQGVRMRQRKIL